MSIFSHTKKYPYFVLIALMLCLCTNNDPLLLKAAETNATEIIPSACFPYIITINTLEYHGIYTGETISGIPDGEGIFTTNKDCFIQFTYNGEFSEGKFDGMGVVTLPDGTYFESKFKEGLPVDRGNIYYPDGTKRGIRHSKGIPYGITATYSNSSELLSYDFYYDGETISSLKQASETVNYRKLYQNPQEYHGDILKIIATVTEVYENKGSCIFKIQDEEENSYWGQYENTKHKKYNQSIMPTLHVGDSLELYVYFMGLNVYDSPHDPSGVPELLPQIRPITGITNDFSVDRSKPSFKYSEVLRFPYYYYQKTAMITGTIDKLVLNNNTTYYKLSDVDKNSYYFLLDDDYEGILPIPGDTVTFKGTYYGLFKEYNSTSDTDASLYVYLETDSVKII